jgi:uncharacterized circularly permuted ATP-grasp superfamily protein/uncharacterized alpha-E superfamily protein
MPPPPERPESLFARYRIPPGTFDGLSHADGSLRPHAAPMIGYLDQLGQAEIQRRWGNAQRQLANDGIIFSPFDAKASHTRPWELDALPMLIPLSEWKGVEQGLTQRAEFWELVLADLFGPQTLIREKVIPPALLFGNPLYQPAYHELLAARGRYLTVYAADIARSSTGDWWVAGDRTRAPLGLGYALENRVVMARMLPEAFRQFRVMRMASTFAALHETLRQMAPRYQDNPRIVVWTEGRSSHTYFEDAYLARYLGYTLVEGGDLAVRDQRVMLKTLSGLQPVEVLFRRIDDEDADPVELRQDSISGVSGLLEVLRGQRIAVANSLGSRLAESPAFAAFLPAMSRHLLKSDLQLATVPTWWCGQRPGLDYVLSNFDGILIRSAFRAKPTPPWIPNAMSRDERAKLVAEIQARPENFVGCEYRQRGMTPVWTDQGPTPWHAALRSFVVGCNGGWKVLPGGLVRVSPESDVLDHAMTWGERSQDAWVLSDAPVEATTLLPPVDRPLELRRTGAILPSRVADNLLWLGRYVERADATARLLRSVITELIESSESRPETMGALLRVLAEQGQIEPSYVVADLAAPLPKIEKSLPLSVFDESEPRSLRSIISDAVRLASTLRERLASDAWRVIHHIDRLCHHSVADDTVILAEMLEMLDDLVTELSAFAGIVHESMTRTHAWRFLDLGRRIERASQIAFVLRVTLVRPLKDERPLLESIMRAMDSILTYRTRYLATIQAAPVLDLLLTDESNPRSLVFQLARIAEHVEGLPRDAEIAVRGPEQLLSLSLLNSARLADVTGLATPDDSKERTNLRRFLIRTSEQLQRLNDVVTSKFLIHAGLSRHFTSLKGNKW